jgi:hypothetical protein
MLICGSEDMSGSFEVGVVVALNGCRDSDASLAELDNETQLSPRCAAFCVVALSLLSWAVVLVPLWALIR